MRRLIMLGSALLVGLGGSGCPEVYGKGGSLDDAMREDIEAEQEDRRRIQDRWKSRSAEPCPEGKTRKMECDASDACRWVCR